MSEYNPQYMLSQIKRLEWEKHILRRLLTVHGADMDKVSKMTDNEAWMKEAVK